jgi:hypothetical protein
MFNCDSAFRIGASHDMCEDYAYTAKDHVVICDGSSSARNSDWGARILAKNTSDLLKVGIDNSIFNLFPQLSIFNSKKNVEALGLNLDCLCATQLFINVSNRESFDEFQIYIFGDGGIYVEYFNGVTDISVFKYSPISAPFYPYYLLSSALTNSYFQSFPNQSLTDIVPVTPPLDITRPIIMRPILEDIKKVLIFSDGVSSFIDKQTGKSIDAEEIIKELADIKSSQGSFIKRRLNACIKKVFNKNGWIHLDDLSVAGFIRNENHN